MSAPRMSRKLHLSLRKTELQREVEQAKYPKDLATALLKFESTAANISGEQYEQVLQFIHLQRFGSFWRDAGCKTLVEWLARKGLPYGATLANREIIVRLFDKETFITAGDDLLGEMAFLVVRFQDDSEQRKADYQAIFDEYCRTHEAFDKVEFRKILNTYLNVKYVKPQGVRVADNTARPPRNEPKGQYQHKTPQQTESGEMDFQLAPIVCAGCLAFKEYTESLEKLIRSELGAKRLPVKPKGLI